MNHKPLNCLVACAVATTLALASPALGRGGGGHGGGGMHGGGGGVHGGWGGGMHAMGGGMRFGGIGRTRTLPARVLPVCLSRMRGSHRAFRTVHSITASSTTASIALRSLASPTTTLTTPTMTTAGAGYGRPMDCSGPTSAGTTATIKLAGCIHDDRRPHPAGQAGGGHHGHLRASLPNLRVT